MFMVDAEYRYTLGWWGLVWILSSSYTLVCYRGVHGSSVRNGIFLVRLPYRLLPYLGSSPSACKRAMFVLHLFLYHFGVVFEMLILFFWISRAGFPSLCGQFGVSCPCLFWWVPYPFKAPFGWAFLKWRHLYEA